MPVTLEEVQQCIERLHLIVPKYGLTSITMPQTVRVYRETLESFDGECVKASVGLMLKSVEKFPTPHVWREACLVWLKHNRIFIEREPETDSDGNDIVCRVCRSRARWAVLALLPTPFSAPMTARRVDCDPGETLRRIAVCDASRHHTTHGVVTLPENFVRWAE